MGAIGSFFGLSGGAGGTGFSTPELAKVQDTGITSDDLNNYRVAAQNATGAQQSLMQALQQQGGLQNQSQVYNQLQSVAAGGGPNPAQAMLNNATGQNVANQAALMASQRGAGQNIGLMARNAALQGGNIQQQAVGQGAAMQANQSLGALNAAGQMANTQAANQVGVTNSYVGNQQNALANLYNAIAQQNQTNVSNQAGVNTANAGLAQQGLQGGAGVVGGLINAGGAAAGMKKAAGGVIEKQSGPSSELGQFLKANKGMQVPESEDSGGGLVDVMLSPGEEVIEPENVKEAAGGTVKSKTVPGKAEVKGDSLKNDKVPAKLKPGSVVVPRTKVKDDPAAFVRATLAKKGRGK